ncbi:MAG: TonB-dependent receptor [Algoriphagus sp.]|uniref:TonB-dependent receptor n=1 Tax=Algoriphagus sp. TaxID=1872435 RepID=UPI002731E692|nr:TonB-dependent receptor [Algoriphagus sp.]MDP2042122.1 TonB-dependent receptor [Algoriphagus sp.]MDP3470624.1 TonB-dependent receptor [Algoriphagus sp.]
MKIFFTFLAFMALLSIAAAQEILEKSKLAEQMENYFRLTGQRILILDQDISGLNVPSDLELRKLPFSLTECTDYSFFLFQDKYVVIYPASLRDTYSEKLDKLSSVSKASIFEIKGKLRDNEMKTFIAGGLFSIPQLELAALTNEKGEFSVQVPEGTYIGYFSSMGKQTEQKILKVYRDQDLDVILFETISELDLVTVTDRAIDANVMSTLPGATQMPMEELKLLPPLLGEVDVVRSMLLLPGVSTVGEGASGFNVRGGGVDQNLILMDGAPVFNPSHMFGFFGIFNQDAVNDATLYKGDIPAQFGGRLSSVLDIKTKAGDMQDWYLTGGVGFLSSRLGANGPINDKTQLMGTFRAAYPTWILQRIPNTGISESVTNFTDGNLRIDHRINDRNSLVISAYISSDYFKFGADTAYTWQTNLASMKWKSFWGENLGAETNLTYSGYRYTVLGEASPLDFELGSSINFLGIQQQFEWSGEKLEGLQFGFQVNSYQMGMGDLNSRSKESLIIPVAIPDEQGVESAAYIQIPWKISDKLQGQIGLRYSHFFALGAKDVYQYQPGISKDTRSIVDTISYRAGEVFESYGGFEPRLTIRYAITDDFSVKASVNRSLQYLHLLTNNFASAPVDLWKLSDSYIKPQEAWQYALGIYKNLKQNKIETSLEVYYKDMPRIVEYLDGAQLFLNPALETDLVMGSGYAYGSELLVRKNSGKLNGWISYTFSRSLRKVETEFGEAVNQGGYFPANWDQPHDLTVVSSWQPVRRISFNATFNFRTGRPITLPSGIYDIGGNIVIDYQERNQARIPDYHRLDMGMTYYFYQKKNSNYKSSLNLSFYNVYARRNAFSWFFQPTPELGIPKSYRLAVIGTIIPSVTYNFSIR